ncbi:hypothetical protein ACH5RR_003720 [Cinchona calisaya]|uniref:Prolamin-like domain-containing protein n=1 Tax=Cinchona calisaya TaxID=153742 RepID=A0ABD3AVK4_9GENT
MVKLGVSSILAALIIGSALMAMAQPGPDQNPKVLPQPKNNNHPHNNRSAKPPSSKSPRVVYLDSIPQKVKDYVDNCTKNVTDDCGEEIVGSLFSARKVHSKCCNELVNIGEKCHKTLVNVLSGSPDVKQSAGVLKANGHKVFSYCVRLVKKEHEKNHKGPARP